MVAYLIIDGIVNLTKSKKVKSVIHAGGVIGIKELIKHTPSTVSAEALANTTVCYLDRSTVMDIMQNGDLELSSFFSSLFESKAS
jgi:CRP-like cAMP-binding protein